MRRSATALAITALVAAGGTLSIAAPNAGATVNKAPDPAATTPYVGGTLNVLGSGDVDYLDPNLTYYTTGYLVAREYSRQLYSYPAIKGQTTDVEPDLATGPPVISNGGKTYRITIRSGADWDTTPARQVTAADMVRGVKVTCNPYTPFGGLPDYESLIKGMPKFCANFFKVRPTAKAIGHYLENTPLPGVKAVSATTVQFTLTHRTSYFADELTLPAFSPRAVEMNRYLPGSIQEAHHTISDGPYQVTSYDPARSIVLNRNPAWAASTDPIRKAYVNEIKITEGEQQTSIQRQLAANKPTADVSFDTGPTLDQARILKADHDPRLVTGSAISLNPFMDFNTVSPSNGGALRKVAVRRAISYALNRGALIDAMGGKEFAPALTHVLPPTIGGSRNFNDYPHDLKKAKSLLASSGHPRLTLKFLYRPASLSSTEFAETAKKELKRAGITLKLVGVSDADFYVAYLENPFAARDGRWDLTLAGWGPDWYGQGAASFFYPLFDGRTLPPLSSDFGLYNSASLNALIDRASQADVSTADKLWSKADHKVMSDAAIYPIEDPDNALFHAAQVHNDILIPYLQQGDYTNMWLTPDASS